MENEIRHQEQLMVKEKDLQEKLEQSQLQIQQEAMAREQFIQQ